MLHAFCSYGWIKEDLLENQLKTLDGEEIKIIYEKEIQAIDVTIQAIAKKYPEARFSH